MEEEGHGHVEHLMKHQEYDEETQKRAHIMRDCGWPGDGEGRGWDR